MHVIRRISIARTALLTAGLALALAAGGCGNMLDSDSTARVLSERQRDNADRQVRAARRGGGGTRDGGLGSRRDQRCQDGLALAIG